MFKCGAALEVEGDRGTENHKCGRERERERDDKEGEPSPSPAAL